MEVIELEILREVSIEEWKKRSSLNPEWGSTVFESTAPVVKRLERVRGKVRYELKNFRGDIRQTISDVKNRELDGNGLVAYTADVYQVEDSYPFGWSIKERSFSVDQYRFGFNGKENDKDWGNQLIQDYGFRLYNPAIAKFLSFDPLAPDYPELTPYQFASNTPIESIDLDGLERLSIHIILSGREIVETKMRVTGIGSARRGPNGNLISRNPNGFDDITYTFERNGSPVTAPFSTQRQTAFRYNNEAFRFNQYTINNNLDFVDANGTAFDALIFKEQIVQTTITETTTTSRSPESTTVGVRFGPNSDAIANAVSLRPPAGAVGPFTATIQGNTSIAAGSRLGAATIDGSVVSGLTINTLMNARMAATSSALSSEGFSVTNGGVTYGGGAPRTGGTGRTGGGTFTPVTATIRYFMQRSTTTTTTSSPLVFPWGTVPLGTTETSSSLGGTTTNTTTINQKGTNTLTTPRSTGTTNRTRVGF